MATYEEIYGKRVKEFDSDPTLESSYEGQVWYDKSSGVLKSVVNFFAFRSGGSMPVARDLGTGGGATQNSAWVAAGENGSTVLNSTAEYNGFGWTTSGNVGTGRIRLAYGNNGPESAGLATGGFIPPSSVQSIVEEYNGSTWAAGTGLPTTIQFAGGTGPQTANIILGGTAPLTRSLEYDGSTWTTGGDSSENLSNYGLAGIQTAALAFYGSQNSGGGPPHRTTGEEYNGASWSTVAPSLINQRGSGAATGTTSAAIFLGNSTTVTSWDGTSLTNEPAMSQSRGNGFSGGLATSGVVSGGSAPGSTANVEEFDRSINTITPAAWSSGGVLNTGRLLYGGAGYKESGLVAGGFTSPPSTTRDETEEYNGTTWSEQNDLGTARYENWHVGTQTAALFFGGAYPGYTSGATEEYDGSSWSEQNDLGTARKTLAGAGTQTAGLAFGGSPPTTGKTEEYDGTSWSEQTDMSTARRYLMGFGIQTAAVACGGGYPSAVTTTEEYNGSSWTSSGAMIIAKQRGGAGGIETDGIAFGGGTSPSSPHAVVEGYDGTSWSVRPSTANSKFNVGGGSNTTSTGAFMSGGRPGYVTSTEEFTGKTETVAFKTLTTS